MAVPVGTPDHALLTRARDGDGEAFEALYRRHHRAARRAAHSYSSRDQLAEDAVQEAFLRILRATKEGGGPQTEFRAYLATTVRHVIAGWTRSERTVATEDLEALAGEDTRDSVSPESRLRWHLMTQAFKSLPTRWQEALWLGEVEGVEAAELATRWNMTPNSAAALTYRAREGLRTAWLDAHVNQGLVPDECRPYVADVGRYAQGKLTARRNEQVREHLDECDYCRAVMFEVGAAAMEMRVLLGPIALWSGAVVATGLAAGSLWGGVKAWGAQLGPRGLTIAASSTVAVAAIVVAAINPGAADPNEPDGAASPSQTGGTSGDDSGDGDDGATDAPTDSPTDPAPTDDPTDPASPSVTNPFAVVVTPVDDDPADPEPTEPEPTQPEPTDPSTTEPTDPDPTDPGTTEPTDPEPAAPDPPTAGYQVDGGAIVLSGTGEPGATVTLHVAGATASGAGTGSGGASRSVMLRVPTEPVGAVLQSVEVDGNGDWVMRLEAERQKSLYGKAVVVVQTTDRGSSQPSTTITLPDPPEAPTIESVRVVGSQVVVTGKGEDGAELALSTTEGGEPQVAVVDTESWSLTIDHRDYSGQQLVATQTDDHGFVSPPSAALGVPEFHLPAPTFEVAVVEGEILVSGTADPGADVIVAHATGREQLATATADDAGRWHVTLRHPASGHSVVAEQVATDGLTSSSEPQVLPFVPGPPTVDSARLLGYGFAHIKGTFDGGELVFRLTDGTELRFELQYVKGDRWYAVLYDKRLRSGTTVLVSQVVDGVESERVPVVLEPGNES